MPRHFSDVPNFDFVELREGWVGFVVKLYHPAVIGQPDSVAGGTLLQSFYNVGIQNRCRHLRSVGHRHGIRIRDVVAGPESCIRAIEEFDCDLRRLRLRGLSR